MSLRRESTLQRSTVWNAPKIREGAAAPNVFQTETNVRGILSTVRDRGHDVLGKFCTLHPVVQRLIIIAVFLGAVGGSEAISMAATDPEKLKKLAEEAANANHVPLPEQMPNVQPKAPDMSHVVPLEAPPVQEHSEAFLVSQTEVLGAVEHSAEDIEYFNSAVENFVAALKDRCKGINADREETLGLELQITYKRADEILEHPTMHGLTLRQHADLFMDQAANLRKATAEEEGYFTSAMFSGGWIKDALLDLPTWVKAVVGSVATAAGLTYLLGKKTQNEGDR